MTRANVSLVHDQAPYRIWKIILTAPCQMWSANDAHRGNEYDTARIRKAWRGHTYETLQQARLPKGLGRVHFSVVFHFTSAARRDALNYADTAKPIIDAFGAPFVQKPTKKKPAGASAPGYSLIPDDTPQYVAGTDLSIGDLWQDIITADDYPLTRADVVALDHEWGGITVILAERHALPPAPPRKRVPLAKVIPADVRRRLALEALL